MLSEVVRANQTSDFGRRHKLSAVRSYGDFRRALRLANYQYLKPYIDRCRAGRVSALFGPDEKIVMFALTSGTTAAAKYIPVTSSFVKAYRRGWNIWGVKALSDHRCAFMRKILQVTSRHDECYTEGRIPCGAISGLLAANQKFIVRRFYAAPAAVAQIPEATERYYTTMRLAIAQDVAFISTANPSTTLKLAQTAEAHAQEIIRDVRDGTCSSIESLSRELRERIAWGVRPQPRRAEQLENMLNQHGRLLPRNYWRLAFLANWMGGSCSMYVPKLAEYYGDVPIRDIGLLASEGRCSIPVCDNTAAGILDISANFYEFVPADEIDAAGDIEADDTLSDGFTVLRADELEQGGEYYIFLTNRAGLYRYNLGDRVRVCGHEQATPIIEFLSKGAHVSSITGEKLTESQAVQAVRDAADELTLDVETFVLGPNLADCPFYDLYVQAGAVLSADVLGRLAGLVDRKLGQYNIEYASKRKSSRLGELQCRQVVASALTERDRELMKANQGRSEQFKHRFVYNKPVQLDGAQPV